MKTISALLLSAFIVSQCWVAPATVQTSLNEDLRDLVHAVITNGNLRGYLQNSRFAVLGFRDGVSDKGCLALSRGLADRVQVELDRISGVIANVVDSSFRLVERQSLLAIEDECTLANPETCPKVEQLLAPSDVLITGSWTHYNAERFMLTLKALRMGETRNTELLATRRAQIAKVGLTQRELRCLDSDQANPAPRSTEIDAINPVINTPSLPSITGKYQGELRLSEQFAQKINYQGERSFYFALDIDQQNQDATISGLAQVAKEPQDSASLAQYRISGNYNKEGFFWQGQAFVKRANPQRWCMVRGHLRVNPNNPKQLIGTWQSNPDVAGGCEVGDGDIVLNRQ